MSGDVYLLRCPVCGADKPPNHFPTHDDYGKGTPAALRARDGRECRECRDTRRKVKKFRKMLKNDGVTNGVLSNPERAWPV